MTGRIFTRRRLLIGAGTFVGLGAAVTVGSNLACQSDKVQQAFDVDLSRLLVALAVLKQPHLVGQSYLRSHGAGGVITDLERREDLRTTCRIACDASRLARLEEHFRSDFRQGHYRIVERWVVSDAEALIAGYWIATTPEKDTL